MDWFDSWFDTPYYHALYAHRNGAEAAAFMDRLLNHLELAPGMHVLDVACGKGRHSIHLASRGLQVTGLDLSENSIGQAEAMGISGTEFRVHDMREPFPVSNCDAVMNLFTSFGYFDDPREDARILENMASACKLQGYVVQDYLNAEPVLLNLPQRAEISQGGYKFQIHKYRVADHIIKDISVIDADVEHRYQEKVRIFSESCLIALHEAAGLTVKGVYGNFELGVFDVKSSPRIVVVSQKC